MISGPAFHALTAGSALAAGTPVLTLRGTLRVDDLQPGDRLVTRAGARALRGLRAAPARWLIRFATATLGDARPEADLLVTPETPVLLRDWRARALGGQTQALIPAGRLVDGAFVRREPGAGRQVWHLECDSAAVIYAAGAELGLTPAPVRA